MDGVKQELMAANGNDPDADAQHGLEPISVTRPVARNGRGEPERTGVPAPVARASRIRQAWGAYPQPSTNEDRGIINAAEFATLVQRRWWLVLLLTLLGAAAGWGYAWYRTPIYTATATLLVGPATAANGDTYGDTIGATSSVKTFSDLITLRPVIERALAQLQSSESPSHLIARVKVTPHVDTQLVEVAVRDPRPQEAARIANAISSEYVNWLAEQQNTKFQQSDQTINNRLTQTQTDLATVTAQITTYQSTPPPRTVDEENRITSLQSLQAQDLANRADLANQQQRLTLAQLAAQSRVRIVANAVAPTRPSDLPPAFDSAIGGISGLALALLGLAVFGRARRRIRMVDDIRMVVDVPVIAVLPRIRASDALGVDDTKSASAEAIRALRTRLQFATYGKVAGIVAVTSPGPDGGKSLIAANLAMALAQGGQSVLLVDGNLREPTLHERFGKAKLPGLSNLLQNPELQVDDVLVRGPHPKLLLLLAGTHEAEANELLASKRLHPIMQALRTRAEVVLIDTPSLAQITDAMLFTAEADYTVILVPHGRTSPDALRTTIARVRETGSQIAGIVLTAAARGFVP